MASPSKSRATKRRRSSMTELTFHGIHTSRRTKAESVTHVSGTKCHLCLGPLIQNWARQNPSFLRLKQRRAFASVAGRKQFVEQVAEPGLEHLDRGLGDRDLGPLRLFLLGWAAPSSNWWP